MGTPAVACGAPGTGGACLEGGGGACALLLCCGVALGSTMNSVGREDGVRRCDAGRLLRSFMRLVESVRLNCAVRSCAQVSDSCCCCCGTGLRLGMPLLLSMFRGGPLYYGCMVRTRSRVRWWARVRGEVASERGSEGELLRALNVESLACTASGACLTIVCASMDRP